MAVERKIRGDKTPVLESANSEVVRSIAQRNLLNRWLRIYDAKKTAPTLSDYIAEGDIEHLPGLASFSVKKTEHPPRIVVKSAGTLALNVYGSADKTVTGADYDLADSLGPKLASAILPLYYESIERQLPVYSISNVRDVTGKKVDLERLILPFTKGEDVTHLLSSVETISAEGRFEYKNLMRENATPPIDELRAIIDRDLFHARPGAIPSKDTIEFE